MLLLWHLWAHQKRLPQEKAQLSVIKTERNSSEGEKKEQKGKKKKKRKEKKN